MQTDSYNDRLGWTPVCFNKVINSWMVSSFHSSAPAFSCCAPCIWRRPITAQQLRKVGQLSWQLTDKCWQIFAGRLSWAFDWLMDWFYMNWISSRQCFMCFMRKQMCNRYSPKSGILSQHPSILLYRTSTVKYTSICIAHIHKRASNALVRSLVIWYDTVLPANRQRWFSRLYPGILPVLIYWLQKDERLSWPRWLVVPKWFTHPSINRARHRVTTLIKTNALPLSQATTETIERKLMSCLWRVWRTGPKDDDIKADASGDEPTVNGALRQRAGTPRHR